MIVKMKKVTLLCLEQDKTDVLEQLRELGVMQLEYAKTPETDDVTSQTRRLSEVSRAAMLLLTEEGKASGTTDLDGGAVADRVLALAAERAELSKTEETLRRELEALLPWGEFDPASLEPVRAGGLHPYLCVIRKPEFRAVAEGLAADVMLTEISRDKINVYALIVSPAELDPETICAADLPDTTVSAVKAELAAAAERRKAVTEEMLSLKSAVSKVMDYAKSISGTLEFASARDGMAESGKVAWIFGYVPVTCIETLRKAAKEYGMALLIEDPAPDDEKVPTYIVKPKFLDIMDPLFDFIGVTPGYRENDVNLFFLIFFPIFFGIIIGDAGYGLLFIAAAVVCKIAFRKKEAARLALNLFLLLSVVTLIWGWLNGAWCGIPRELLPDFMRGCDFLADPSKSHEAFRFAHWAGLIRDDMSAADQLSAMSDFKNKFIQFICFAIAAVHLPSARLFRFFDDIRGTWRAFGHLGWAMLLFANAILATSLIVYTDILTVHPALGLTMKGLYAAGVALVVITVMPSAAMNLPFSLVGSFVDVLSYIRLFAVALAGGYISEKFDGMGADLLHSVPDTLKVLGMILLALVAVLGNLLNIALGFLSVLVHAIRLNTLEFSNHIEMQWAGFRFHPFRKDNNKVS